ncbi:hypothetical protein ACYSNO_06650 [Enterococcus sp. LJL98]
MNSIVSFFKLKSVHYFLSFLFVFLLLVSTLAITLIFTSYNLFKVNNLQSFEPLVTVEFNPTNLESNQVDTSQIINPTKEDYIELAHQEEVNNFEISLTDILLTPTLKDLEEVEESGLSLFNIKGVNNEFFYDIRLNNIVINNGRTFNHTEIIEATDSIILSDFLAQKNNLEIGQKIGLGICNPSNPEEIYTKEFILIGTFDPSSKIGTKNIDTSKITDLLGNLLHHSDEGANTSEHNHEEHSTSEQRKTDFDNVESLQKLFLFEDLSTIYLPNKTIEKLNQELDDQFGNEYSSADYQAVFSLRSHNQLNTFKQKANKILPEYFIVFDINDAYQSWVPNMARNEVISFILSILLLILCVISISLIILLSLFKEKKFIKYLLSLGINLKVINSILTKKIVKFIIPIFSLACISAPSCAKYIFQNKLIYIDSEGGYFFNIQNFSRNLISMNHYPSEYTTFNFYYLMIIIFFALLLFIIIKSSIKYSLYKTFTKEQL